MSETDGGLECCASASDSRPVTQSEEAMAPRTLARPSVSRLEVACDSKLTSFGDLSFHHGA